ncbi:RPA-interacting protein [Danio rerio]|uniref:RPA-interacting protein n=1 Tax=Danio rerio TaxID=7955 RepID=Q0P498_DANRE|nr:RPA-interacting protein [Danio rerio]AAI22207.1 Zgc:153251 [Danio rerio]|eukprot:NP_001038853.1 RPA-interacting protein [Danio rerio]
MDAVQRHRSMYKGTTPPWKETYRKRCVERLKNSRSRLLEKFRQMTDSSGDGKRSLLVQEVMEEEWSALKASHSLPSLWNGNPIPDVYTQQQEFDELSALEEIQQELIAQELAILEEYNNSMRYEEQYLDSVLEGMDQGGQIICPVCHANNLTVNSHFTMCSCGLYVNTIGRNVTSEVLQNFLERRVNEHMEDCLHNPSFSMAFNTDQSTNLMISCKVCDYLSVVL